MSHIPRTPRAVAQRQALGRRLRAHRLALGLGVRDVAAHGGTSKVQLTAIENATADVVTGTLIDVAAAVGLEVGVGGVVSPAATRPHRRRAGRGDRRGPHVADDVRRPRPPAFRSGQAHQGEPR